MRYILSLLNCEVKFSHAGQGSSFSKNSPGDPFSGVMTSALGEKKHIYASQSSGYCGVYVFPDT
jgi:hypothetical protein